MNRLELDARYRSSSLPAFIYPLATLLPGGHVIQTPVFEGWLDVRFFLDVKSVSDADVIKKMPATQLLHSDLLLRPQIVRLIKVDGLVAALARLLVDTAFCLGNRAAHLKGICFRGRCC